MADMKFRDASSVPGALGKIDTIYWTARYLGRQPRRTCGVRLAAEAA